MRKFIVCGVVVGVSFVTFGFIPKHSAAYYEAIKPEVQEATRKGAKAKIIYRVIDDEGTPITNTTVRGTWRNDFPRKTWNETFVTNTNGEFVAKGKVGGAFGFFVRKEGYYLSSTGLNFHRREGVSPLVKDGKWQPYGAHRTLVVKRKKNPVEMSYRHTLSCDVPATNVWLGLDLESFQWTSPYGSGKHDDMLLRFNYEMHDKYAEQWATMDISFTNNPCAGFYMRKQDLYSLFKSTYHADTNAVFSQTCTFRMAFPGEYQYTLGKDDYMVFRTRTKVDKNGNLVCAHYGKIYGAWEFGKGMNVSDIYFNPTPNDSNLEFDPKREGEVLPR